jgi:hypothetical protein
MRKLIFIFLLAGTAKADSTLLKKAGTSFAVSKTMEIISIGVTAGAILSKDEYSRKSLLIFSAMSQLAAVTFYYRGCNFLIKANGITVRF